MINTHSKTIFTLPPQFNHHKKKKMSPLIFKTLDCLQVISHHNTK